MRKFLTFIILSIVYCNASAFMDKSDIGLFPYTGLISYKDNVSTASYSSTLGGYTSSQYLITAPVTGQIVKSTNTWTSVQIFDVIQVSTTTSASPIIAGSIYWNQTDGAINIVGKENKSTLQVGQESYIIGVNKTGGTISNGKPVYISGVQGNRPTIAYAKGDSTSTCNVIGLATHDILDNEEGYITIEGYVRQLDTSVFPEGCILYVSTSTLGELQCTTPQAPHHSDVVGILTNSSVNQGSILVQIQRHKDLADLSDVNGTPLTTTGQFPMWNQTRQVFDFDNNFVSSMTAVQGDITVLQNNATNYLTIFNTTNTWTAGNYWLNSSTFSNTVQMLSTATILGRLGVGMNNPEYRIDAVMPGLNHLRTRQSGFNDNVNAVMTDYAVPVPFLVSSSGEVNTVRRAWRAFDNDTGSGWISNASTPYTLTLDLGAGYAVAVTSYNVIGVNTTTPEPTLAPKSWNIRASNDGTNWVIIDTQTNVASWGTGERRGYSIPNTTAYRYYQMYGTTTQGGSYFSVVELNYVYPYKTAIDVTSDYTSFGSRVSSYTFQTNNGYLALRGDVGNNRGEIVANKELYLGMSGDLYGSVYMRFLNRLNQVGVLFWAPSTNGYGFTDLMLADPANVAIFRTIRFNNWSSFNLSGDLPCFNFGTDTNPKLLVDDNKVFIRNVPLTVNTTNIAYTCNVYGTAQTTGTTVLATFAGNVGIGKTNPTVKLDVNGSVKVSSYTQTVDLVATGQTRIKMPYGAFYSTTTQSIAVINTTQTITLDGAIDANGVSYANNCIIPSLSGEYLITFSALPDGDVSKMIWIFPRINGVNVPYSNTPMTFEADHKVFPFTVTYNLDLNAGDCFELIMYSDDVDTQLAAYPASTTPVAPASPSIIITINKTGEIQ